jgi:hypothetical protein
MCIQGDKNLKETVNEFQNCPIKDSGCIVASDHRVVKRGSTPSAASLLLGVPGREHRVEGGKETIRVTAGNACGATAIRK